MDAAAEIKQLYYGTSKATIQRDLSRAVALLKTLGSEDEREEVAVYMDGLSQMRSEWGVRPKAAPAKAPGRKPAKAAKPPRPKR
jgi:hypothetical protein